VREFIQEPCFGPDSHDSRMSSPGEGDPTIDLPRLRCTFAPNRILLVTPRQHRNLDLNNGGVTLPFFLEIDFEFIQEALPGTRPIGKSVERSAITENNRGIAILKGDRLEFPLDVKYRALRGAPAFRRICARKATAENDTGGFWSDGHMLAEIAARHLEHGRLSASGTSGEHYQLRIMTQFPAAARVRSRG
jgi:hypothetical protein